jgi:DNA modification methylase
MKNFFETKSVSIEKLIPYALNSRTHSDAQVAQIAASIREFGFTNPVLVDDENNLIAGHGRVMAARKLGMDEVPAVIVTGLDDRKRRALIIADNKLALNAGWDEEALRVELQDLAADYGELMGFAEDELEALLIEATPTEGLTDEDEVPEVPDEPVTKLGDVWLLGRHRLMCGDSTSVNAVEKLMDGEKADFCFTSPPYNLGKSVALRNGARNGADSAYNDFSDDGEWPNLMRGFISNSIMFADVSCINVQMLSGNKFDLLKLFGDYARHTVDIAVWSKSNPPPATADGVMTSAFEFMWFLSSEENPNRRIKGASFQRGTFSNVFEHSTASGHDASVHGAVFPLPLAEHFIQNCSQKTAIVMEFFGGTGTTMIACEKLGRSARLMELDPKYCDVIIKRWQDFTGKEAKLESNGKTFKEISATNDQG